MTLPELYCTIEPWLTHLRTHNLPDFIEPTLGRQIRGEPAADFTQYANTITDPEEIALLTGKDPAATLIAHTDDYKLVRPNHVAAARFYGRETQWCTNKLTSRTEFDNYNKTGSLFVLLLPKTQEKLQMHFGVQGEQIADSSDTSISNNHLAFIMDEAGLSVEAQSEMWQALSKSIIDDGRANVRFSRLPSVVIHKEVKVGDELFLDWIEQSGEYFDAMVAKGFSIERLRSFSQAASRIFQDIRRLGDLQLMILPIVRRLGEHPNRHVREPFVEPLVKLVDSTVSIIENYGKDRALFSRAFVAASIPVLRSFYEKSGIPHMQNPIGWAFCRASNMLLAPDNAQSITELLALPSRPATYPQLPQSKAANG